MYQGVRTRFLQREMCVQASLITMAMAVVVAPPVEGTIAIMPAVSGDTAATYRWALAAGALPIAPGPYPGSLVVQGSLRALLLPAIEHRAILLSEHFAGCGPNAPGEHQ